MPYEDLREFISLLEESNQLRRISQPVHWKYELGGWIRKTMDMRAKGPALLFANIKGYSAEYRALSAVIGTHQRFALALGLDAETSQKEIINVFSKRIADPIPPVMISTGPLKQNIHVNDEIDLLEFPIPWLTPRDGGRYVGSWPAIVTKDPSTGVRNVGSYRVMVHDRCHAGISLAPSSHMGIHYNKAEIQGKALEAAIVIGADETLPMAAGTSFPLAVDEYTMAGALRRAALELVKCETVDLEVPANAEIVIEGRLLPFERREEGPFSEHSGYHAGGVRMRPVFEVSAICHRNQPIFRCALLGKPTTEDHSLFSVAMASNAMRVIEAHGLDGVVAINCPPEGDSVASAIVSMRPRYVGHSLSVGRALLSSPAAKYIKYVVVVDDDIDPFDLGQVWWAIIYRTQGSRDLEVMRFCPSSKSDPSIPRDWGDFTDKVLIDATKKLDYPFDPVWGGYWAPVGFPPDEIMQLVDLRWKHIFEGAAEVEGQISELTEQIETDGFDKWDKWRENAYKLTEEQKQKEIQQTYRVSKQGTG